MSPTLPEIVMMLILSLLFAGAIVFCILYYKKIYLPFKRRMRHIKKQKRIAEADKILNEMDRDC